MEPGRIENLSVVYQSQDFLVVNKHWDLRIDSRMWRETPTLQKQLRHHFPELADPDTYYGFRFCHQLDFSTSGALCVALNKAAAGSAYKCFKERRVTKAYLALQVRGHVRENRMTINYAIGRNSTEGRAHTMCIEGTQGCENPKPSLTELVVLEHGLYAGDPVSKVLLQPLTVPLAHRSDTPAACALQCPQPSCRGGPDVRAGTGPRRPAVPHDAARLLSAHPHSRRACGGLHTRSLRAGARCLLEPPHPGAVTGPARPGPEGCSRP
ncbi:RNA pseudouridylate synthase domain-containing protein 1 isoform X4 [Ursus americanus]|uniref:RNA pseudouridylate synthase domain-containing protein 1 isoform X4 n=1 Tax=Ursus maritimus TaxID=29073 RepID=A0A8M1GI55_URSMA|nr:RNA pseudouridylate synthase domain-containing protein 1 isoform X4 [Ursus arctos]XP_040491529.1 RNA pseudouridylate synthase domain-containing protein 1 isoform X4 [Ursus maritimus]XP_045640532.1 RNA pseudouridylate synthase domain-containing protein 1 isoform X4 [Ursus americanus]